LRKVTSKVSFRPNDHSIPHFRYWLTIAAAARANVGFGEAAPGAFSALAGSYGPFGTNGKMIALSDRLLLAAALDPCEPTFASFADCRARIGLSF
jgi:hypothetical protein